MLSKTSQPRNKIKNGKPQRLPAFCILLIQDCYDVGQYLLGNIRTAFVPGILHKVVGMSAMWNNILLNIGIRGIRDGSARPGIILTINKDQFLSISYSQGGAVALAAQRYIEQNGLSDQLHFRGTLCGDGPYDLISTLQYYLDDDGTSYDVTTVHRKDQVTLPVVIPMIMNGMIVGTPDMA